MCKISVIIPTFNRAHLLERAISSVLSQTVRPSQIIVVDDGSTDNTGEICRKYGEAIDYVHQPNAGASAARNQGIRHIRHPWTAFLDSDDFWTPTHLEAMTGAIAGTLGQARFYFSDLQSGSRNNGNTVWKRIGFGLSGPCLLKENGAEWMLLPQEPCFIQCSVFKTGLLQECGGFNPRFRVSEDRDLFYRLGIGGPVCAVNAVGCIKTSDATDQNRLTGIIPAGSQGFWEHECMLWSGLAQRFLNLTPSQQRALHFNLAIAHWRLARMHWRSGRVAGSAVNFLQSVKTHPSIILWLLGRGPSQGADLAVSQALLRGAA